MIRILDFFLSLVGLILLIPLLLVIWVLARFDSHSPLFVQERVGFDQKPFFLVKFRTMKLDTESVPTHFTDSSNITNFGHFLRRTKVDELPQLWNVLRGEMSLVGPRPCLYNQFELIKERQSLGVFSVRPGITGLAQIKGIDMSTPTILAKTDTEMLKTLNVFNYFKYIFLTVIGKGFGDRVKDKLVK